jgi:hypothetical protein
VISSRGALASVLLATLTLPGCDDPPTCSVQVGISGATEGAANWSLSGDDQCAFVDAGSIGTEGTAMVFTQGSSQIILVIDTPTPIVGGFAGTAVFLSGGYAWQAPADSCAVGITEFDREDWSRQDFIQIAGTFQCAQPLVSNDAEVGDVTLTPLTFEAHLYDDLPAASIF